jgi:hypothetical protein
MTLTQFTSLLQRRSLPAMFGKVLRVYTLSKTKPIDIFCVQNCELLNVKIDSKHNYYCFLKRWTEEHRYNWIQYGWEKAWNGRASSGQLPEIGTRPQGWEQCARGRVVATSPVCPVAWRANNDLERCAFGQSASMDIAAAGRYLLQASCQITLLCVSIKWRLCGKRTY